MLALNDIHSRHGPTLILDASSTVIHGGWLPVSGDARWTRIEAEASAGIFQVLSDLGSQPREAACFVFCEGPGSILGIRTVATVLRTWIALQSRPVYAYRSLELTAHQWAQPGEAVICDARRQSWHTLTRATDATLGPIKRVATADLPGSGLLTPDGFRRWSALPAAAPRTVPYDPTALSGTLANTPLLRETNDPDAFLHEDPSYATWTPQVHQAPPPKS
ncbi:peptidase M22 [Synoicihabitans lomoniglobus]|uniref:Peptidase M22 n=1 Tax=Synoicihabitans lomoniglobus TaxID=2909285 RepID=A0AAF0I4G0_9BACT|nr:peptidase M22 [Opitutaceae bacterium LMO-M01]WED66465.1 peptidase M22 [Opitutaceae bacterium LMO-M01]